MGIRLRMAAARGRRHVLLALVLCALVLSLGLLPRQSSADTVELDAENLLRLGASMLEQGKPGPALAVAEALLKQDAGDARYHALKSRAERDLGRNEGAVVSARKAWGLAEGEGQRHDAAMAMAQGLASGGSKFRAQFWLRRAIDEAPDARARAEAERDFSYVRSRSRLSLRFDAGFRPSSNVNNGSSSDILWFYGFPLVLSGDAKALSGVEGNLAIGGRWRLQESERRKTDLTFDARQQMVWLSGEAKRQAPDAKGSDYAWSELALGLEHAWKAGKSVEFIANGNLARRWYGGDPLSNVAEAGLAVQWRPQARLMLRGSYDYARHNRLDSSRNSSDIDTFGLAATILMRGSGDRIDLGVTLRDTDSASGEIANDMVRLRLDWARAKPVLGAKLSMAVWTEEKDFSASRYVAGGRDDRTVAGEIAVTLEKADYMGFVPVVTIGASKTQSNVSLFENRSSGVGLSIRSRF